MKGKVGIPCRFCGKMDVYFHTAPNGKVYYQCDTCYEKWEGM